MKADVLFLILAGIVALIVLKVMPPGAWGMPVMGVPTTTGDLDQWMTPFYLRYNISPPSPGIRSMMPVPANYTYALGVPSAPFTQTAVTSPGNG